MNRRSLMLPAAALAVVLTMMSMAQVFVRQRWFIPSLLAIGLAFGTGWVARRLDVPGALAPALSVLVLVTWLGLVFLPETTAFGLPTSATMEGIGELLSDAGRDIRETAPPADPTDGLTLLATAGVFLVAMLVDVLVFTLRRPVAAGMPLLALYLIPTSMTESANVFAFVVAATGYLTLLVAEGRDRARNWGRRLTGIDLVDDVADVSHVARVGRRIGTAAVGIALCVPLVVPSVGTGIFDSTGGGLFGRGNGSKTKYVLNPLVEIRAKIQDDVTQHLLTVRTDATPQYLRLTTLDRFDGKSWSFVKRKVEKTNRVGRDKDIPAPPELTQIPSTVEVFEVAVGALAVAWLPIPYAPVRVDVDKKGDWRYEDFGLSVFSASDDSDGVTFVAQSRIATPSRADLMRGGVLPDHIRDNYLGVPQPTPDIATQVLREQTKGLTDKYDIAVALNEYFFRTGGFRYNDKVALTSSINDLESFLRNKQGYCEQYAATMAYLARLAGIPSRVVVGFTPGERQPDGTFHITNKDAHAWPELYFPSAGWVRFEPTPRGGTERPGYAVPPPSTAPPAVDPSASPEPTDPAATPSASESGRPRALDEAGNQGADGQNRDGAANGGFPYVPLGAALALALVGAPSAVAFGTRRRRNRRADSHVSRIHAAWDSLADAAEDTGYALRAADSPRGAARRLVTAAGLTGVAADEVSRLASAEERARYARSAPPVDGLDAGVRAVRKALVATLPGRKRLRAQVFPPSALRRMVDAVRGVLEAVDRRRTASRRWAAGLLRRRPRTA